jgi:SAM-dependent methyltransferase
VQITKAREITKLPDTHLIVGDIQGPGFLGDLPPDFVGKCDKIFSSAALHWCNKDPFGVLVNAHKILKRGGIFVAEMGGHGNVSGTSLPVLVYRNQQGTYSTVQVSEMHCTPHCRREG